MQCGIHKAAGSKATGDIFKEKRIDSVRDTCFWLEYEESKGMQSVLHAGTVHCSNAEVHIT